MPIVISEFPDPLTPAADRELLTRPSSAGGPRQGMIGSDALRLVQHELRKYCGETVAGRSFLIAGHRGAGKTTLVHGAFQRVRDEIRAEEEKASLRPAVENLTLGGYPTPPPLRPLLILLQGPNLLPPPQPVQAPAPSPAPTTNPEKKPESNSAQESPRPVAANTSEPSAPSDAADARQQMETVLIQITLGLYRALADEFSRYYAERVSRLYGRSAKSYGSIQMLELAAKFELELDQYPGTDRLREYWRMVDAFGPGVLFRSGPGTHLPPDQGLRELIALSTACEAYQRICGTLSRQDQKTSGTQQKTEAAASVNAKGSDWLKPVAALLAGGTVGAGVLAAQHDAYYGATLAGFVTALASSVAIKYSSSRTSQRAIRQADLFIPDLSLTTLDRLLPVLLKRIRRAGLAPVFVVDELDKIDGLSDRITDMVKRLKKLVAESAFFCFLTDRKYFEEMIGRTTDAPYPIEYTYFTNQLFITFGHRDLHQYLANVLEASRSSTSRSGPAPAETPADPLLAEETSDLQVLPFLLLYAAQMHPIDLRRQLLAVRDEQGYVRFRPGEVRTRPRYTRELMIQVAVEMVLESEDMRSEIDVRPAFLQIVHDALYYISRRWNTAPRLLHLDDDCKHKFAEYLKDRMATDSSEPKENSADGDQQHADQEALDHDRDDLQPAANENGTVGFLLNGIRKVSAEAQRRKESSAEIRIDAPTVDFLLDCVRELARLLTSPSSLREAAEANPRISQVVVNALPAEPLLEWVPGRAHVYRWLYYPSGRPVRPHAPPEAAPAAPQTGNWAETANVAFINQFRKSLAALTGDEVDLALLASGYGIISTSPAWDDVRRAIERLQAARQSDQTYREQEDDRIAVRGFRVLLQRSSTTIAHAFLCAVALAAPARKAGIKSDLSWSLGAISSGLRLIDRGDEAVAEKLKKLLNEILKVGRDTPRDLPNPPLIQDSEDVVTWQNKVAEARRTVGDQISITAETEQAFIRSAWDYWYAQVARNDDFRDDPGFDAIFCRVALAGPGKYLSFGLSTMGVTNWTHALIDALASLAKTGAEEVEPWLAMAALHRLGFSLQTLNGFQSETGPIWTLSLDIAESATPEQKRPGYSTPPCGVIVYKGNSTVANWLPSSGYPLLVMSIGAAQKLIASLAKLPKELLRYLAVAFVAFDISDEEQKRSPRARIDILDRRDREILEFFSIDSGRPVPILVHDISRAPGSLGPRYFPVAPQSARDLFSAVASQGSQPSRELPLA